MGNGLESLKYDSDSLLRRLYSFSSRLSADGKSLNAFPFRQWERGNQKAMSTWQDILREAASGDLLLVEEYLRHVLPLELRSPVSRDSRGLSAYEGPVVKAVLNSFGGLTTKAEQELAESRVDDVVDYVTDQIIDKVKRTADIVTFCRLNPDLGIGGLAEHFTGWNNLKRSLEERVEWIKLNLGSMLYVGIRLPADSIAVQEVSALAIESTIGFEERALIKKWDVRKSWNAFKRQQELTDNFLCVQDTDADDDVSAESFDFGVISESRLQSFDPRLPEGQILLEMNELALAVTEILESVLDDLDRHKSGAGYVPIAWHNVWWHFTDKYSGMPLRLRLEDPPCETDHLLADHILQHYAAVAGINRLSVQRRRTQLTANGDKAIFVAVMDYMGR